MAETKIAIRSRDIKELGFVGIQHLFIIHADSKIILLREVVLKKIICLLII